MLLGGSAIAQEMPKGSVRGIVEPVMEDKRPYADRGRLVDTLMAEDRVALDETLAELRPTLAERQDALFMAELAVIEAEMDGGGALIAYSDTQVACDAAQKVLVIALRDVAEAEKELKRLRALPSSQEAQADIDALQAELLTLETNASGARRDLVRVKEKLERTREKAGIAENTVGDAQVRFQSVRNEVDAAETEIAALEEALAREQGAAERVAESLSDEQLIAFNQSLGNAQAGVGLVNIDAAHVQAAIDENYSPMQIQYLVRALETEAKFIQIAATTGYARFLDTAQREKEKLLSQIDYLEAEKFDVRQGANGALAIASGRDDGAADGAARAAETVPVDKALPERLREKLGSDAE